MLRRNLYVMLVVGAVGLGSAGLGMAGPPPTLIVNPTTVMPGGSVTISGDQCITKGDTIVQWWVTGPNTMGGTPVDSGTATPNGSGDWTTVHNVAANASPGTYYAQAQCHFDFELNSTSSRYQGEQTLLFTYDPAPFQVVQPSPSPSPSVTPTPTPTQEPVEEEEEPEAKPAKAVRAQPTFTG